MKRGFSIHAATLPNAMKGFCVKIFWSILLLLVRWPPTPPTLTMPTLPLPPLLLPLLLPHLPLPLLLLTCFLRTNFFVIKTFSDLQKFLFQRIKWEGRRARRERQRQRERVRVRVRGRKWQLLKSHFFHFSPIWFGRFLFFMLKEKIQPNLT